MATLTDPRILLSGLAIVSVSYALLGLVVFAVGTYWPNPTRRTIGRYLAVASPLPIVLFGLLAGLVAVSPRAVRFLLWLVVLVGAWGPILLSPAIAAAFLLDR